jgi:hypothetical protein
VGRLEEALEELTRSFEVRKKRASALVENGVLNDYWRGNRDALEVCLQKIATLSPEAEPEEGGPNGAPR